MARAAPSRPVTVDDSPFHGIALFVVVGAVGLVLVIAGLMSLISLFWLLVFLPVLLLVAGIGFVLVAVLGKRNRSVSASETAPKK